MSSNSLVGCSFWDRIILQSCHQEPAIKHAVLALSALHQTFEHPNEDEDKRQHRAFADKQYRQALAQARLLISSARPEDIDRILITCIIFIVYEGICGNYAASQLHMQSGRWIVIQNRSRIAQISRRQDVNEIYRALWRLDLPALTFQDSTSCMILTIDEFFQTQPLVEVWAFATLSEARASLIDLIRWVYAAGRLIGDTARPEDRIWLCRFQVERAKCRRQLRLWREHFDSFLKSKPDLGPSLHVKILHAWSLITFVMIEGDIVGPETRWDSFQHCFEEVLCAAEEIASELAKKGECSFSTELGYLAPTFFVATRCRDPLVRRRAIKVLGANLRQEGIWGSTAAEAVAQRWMEVEEEDSTGITRADDVPEHNRIQQIDVTISVGKAMGTARFTLAQHGELVIREEVVSFRHPLS